MDVGSTRAGHNISHCALLYLTHMLPSSCHRRRTCGTTTAATSMTSTTLTGLDLDDDDGNRNLIGPLILPKSLGTTITPL